MSEHQPEQQGSEQQGSDRQQPEGEEGVFLGAGEPNSFEPEEDPDAAAGDPEDTDAG